MHAVIVIFLISLVLQKTSILVSLAVADSAGAPKCLWAGTDSCWSFLELFVICLSFLTH